MENQTPDEKANLAPEGSPAEESPPVDTPDVSGDPDTVVAGQESADAGDEDSSSALGADKPRRDKRTVSDPPPTNHSGETLGDMTTGKPAKTLLKFALPLLGGNAFQQLYNIVDGIIVGNYVGAEGLAGVSASFPVILLITSIFAGIGLGGAVLLSQCFGSKNYLPVKQMLESVYTIMFVVILPVSLFGIFMAEPIMTWINMSPGTPEFAEAVSYLRMVMIGLIGSFGFNINMGVLLGLGNSLAPFLFLLISCVANIGLDFLFVLGFDMRSAGAAAATVISQGISWIIGIIYINKRYSFLNLELFKFRFYKDISFKAIKLGIPSGIQQSLFAAGLLLMQSLVNYFETRRGVVGLIAGFGAASKIETFAIMPLQSIGSAMTTYTGQNIGASKIHRIGKGLRSSLWISGIYCALLLLISLFFSDGLIMMFNSEPGLVAIGSRYLQMVLPFLFLFATLTIFNETIRGSGNTFVPMLITLAAVTVVRIPTAYLLAQSSDPLNMFFSSGIGWAVGTGLAMVYYFSGRWKHRSVIHHSEQA